MADPTAAPPPVGLDVLLIEDDEEYVRLVAAQLACAGGDPALTYRLATAFTLASGLRHLARHPIDVVLLDLSLPDSEGLETVMAVRSEAPDVPVVIVTSLADEGLAAYALQSGAQDYLIKDEIEPRILARAVRYAIERHRLQRQLINLSLTDELTGLYNRRGFFTHAERQLKVSRRRGQGLLVVLADLDGLKQINDRFGHAEGDRALVAVAGALSATFRDVDIVARLGGDEFAVLVIDADSDLEEALRGRLLRQVRALNARAGARYTLSLSTGTARQTVKKPRSIDELLARADEALYREKRARAVVFS